MTTNPTQPGGQHPPEWRQDLNPDAAPDAPPAHDAAFQDGRRTAYDVKAVHHRLREWSDDELKRVLVVDEGEPLRQGATYVDLAEDARAEFTATGDMRAGPGHHYVPKDEVDYEIWNRLTGETHGDAS